MKSLSNNISFTRLGFLLKKELKEFRKTFMLRSFILVAALILLSIFVGTAHSDDYAQTLQNIRNSPTNKYEAENYEYHGDAHLRAFGVPNDDAKARLLLTFTFALPITMALSCSFAFERMNSKQRRISFLMTPATILEKYFARLLVVIPGTLVIFFLGCFISDFVRVLLFSMPYPHGIVQFIDASAFREICFDSESFWTGPFPIIATLSLFISSVFTLGSSIWPKASFLKTAGVCAALFFFYLIIFLMAFPRHSEPLISAIINDINSAATFVNTLFILASIFNFTLSYFRLKESEIIQRM